MRCIVPAGIGDWSWMWSKLCHVQGEIQRVRVVDGWPHRTVPYVQACGLDADYIAHVNYQDILTFEQVNGLDAAARPTWDRIRRLGLDNLLLEANQHLERGWPLADWLPDLPTTYHYPLQTTEQEQIQAQQILRQAIPDSTRPILAVSCASYRGSEAWRTWGRVEWVDCLQRVLDLGWQPLLLGGFWDDLTYGVSCSLRLPELVGKTSVGECIELLRHVDGYFGFSSGLGVIRTVLDRPAFCLWPDFQEALSISWAPPAMLASRRYEAALWRPVDDIWPRLGYHLERIQQGGANGHTTWTTTPATGRLPREGSENPA